MKLSTSSLVKIAILAAISVPLMLLESPPLFANFLKLDLGDIPALLGGLSLGPVPAVFIQLIRNLVKLLIKNETGGIGELANFLAGSAYILPLSFIFRRHKGGEWYFVGAALGGLSMVTTASLMNYFILIPLYTGIGGSELLSMILYVIAPFNLVKAVVISIVGFILYRLLKVFLDKS